jgi:predicted heme/steroid binding protein
MENQPQVPNQADPNLTPPSPPPVSDPTLNINKKRPWFLLLLIPVSVLIIFAGVGFYFLNQQKLELKNQTNLQTKSFEELNQNYLDIISTLRNEDNNKSGQDVLGTKDKITLKDLVKAENPSQVLGLEDSSMLSLRRDLNNLFDKGKDISDEIKSNNQKANNLLNKLPLKFFIKDKTGIIGKTKALSQETYDFLDFYDQYNQYEINAVTLGYEWGLLIQNVALESFSDESIQELETKVGEFNILRDILTAIDTKDLPTDIQVSVKEELENFDSDFQIFTDIVEAIRSKDPSKIELAFGKLSLTVSSGQVNLVNQVTYWTDNEMLTRAKDMEKEWQEFHDTL